MKRMILFVILCCLGLAACSGKQAAGEEAGAQATVPKLTMEPPVFPGEEEIQLPILLETAEGEIPKIQGPAGTVPAVFFLGAWCTDPLYGDVDEDGDQELIYLCPGPTSGLYTEAVCVYGLEEDWPVLKGVSIFNLTWGEPHLVRDGDTVLFTLEPASWHPGGEGSTQELLQLPVKLENGNVMLGSGELPEGIQDWGGFDTYRGVSFRELSRKIGADAILNHWSCLIWQQKISVVMDSDPKGKELTQTYAAVTDNGVTVTGLLCWQEQPDGTVFCTRDGIEPAAAAEDPNALVGLSAAELEQRLGPCHFDLGGGVQIPCWLTEDGKLLRAGEAPDTVGGAVLTDLTAGEPVFPRSITVDQSSIPTVIAGQELLEAFVQKTADGEADALWVTTLYSDAVSRILLRYDGSVYTVTEQEGTRTYCCLIVSEENDPPSTARFRSAVHYLLSDDPKMDHDRYFRHMISSTYDPLFPNTTAVVTVYFK